MGQNGMLDYKITYRDEGPGSPTFTTRVRAYNREHAESKFLESGDGDDGWEILKIERVVESTARTGRQ